MNVIIYGTGYVGQVTGACLASKGNKVTLIDVDSRKVQTINSGKPTIIEAGLDSIVSDCVNSGSLSSCNDSEAHYYLSEADLVFIAVGTPYMSDGSIDLSQIHSVGSSIGNHLRTLTSHPSIVVKSTAVPGTTDSLSDLISDSSNKVRGKDYFMAMNPEFLREGVAVNDFLNPDSVVFGGDARAVSLLNRLYSWIPDKIDVVPDAKTAESIKYFKNALLATKIHVANKIAGECEDRGVDYACVKEVFNHMRGVSPEFFRNGPGFGGSCFPKDVLAINKFVNSSLLTEVLRFNDEQALHVIDYSIKAGYSPINRDVAVLGVSFKPGTDDVRESPGIKLIKGLSGIASSVTVYDPLPKALDNARVELDGLKLIFADSLSDVVQLAELAYVMTDWPDFKSLSNLDLPVFFTHRLITPEPLRNKYCLGHPLEPADSPSLLAYTMAYAMNYLIDIKREFGADFKRYFASISVDYPTVVRVACKDKRLGNGYLLH